MGKVAALYNQVAKVLRSCSLLGSTSTQEQTSDSLCNFALYLMIRHVFVPCSRRQLSAADRWKLLLHSVVLVAVGHCVLQERTSLLHVRMSLIDADHDVVVVDDHV